MNKKIYVLTITFLLIAAFGVIAKAQIANVTVRKTADTNNPLPCTNCSLREAVATIVASTHTGQSRIDIAIDPFDPGCNAATRSCQITLSSEIWIFSGQSSMLTIDGGAANLLTIDGGPGTNRIFTVDEKVTIKNMTLQGGNDFGGPGSGLGRAIYSRSDGQLGLDAVVIQNNNATTNSFGAAAVYIDGGTNHSIRNSTIARNSGFDCAGVAVRGNSVGTTLLIVNTTISHNTAQTESGGGLCTLGNFSLVTTLRNVTIANNTAGYDGGGIYHGSGTLNMGSSIVAGNTSLHVGYAPDINAGSATLITADGNLIGNNYSVETQFPVGQPNRTNGDWVGNAAAPINPLLAPLGNYGGTTPTRALFTASLANSHGYSTGPETQYDQRGAFRGSSVIDIGAFEANPGGGGVYTADLPFGLANQPYNQTITADNSGSTYCISSGGLPPGLTGVPICFAALSEDDLMSSPEAVVAISGTPTTAGTYPFTIRVSNGPNSLTNDYQIVVTAPTAASVSVGGRVFTSDGHGIFKARISITNPNGGTRTALTSSFGYFRFDDIEVGQTYILEAAHKRYQFAPRVLSVLDEITDADLIAEP